MTPLMLVLIGLAFGIVIGSTAEERGGGFKTFAGWCFLAGVFSLIRLAMLGAQR